MELSQEQKEIAYFNKSGCLIVNGIAGSGKTTVGLHRVPFLKERFCHEEEDKILIITYTKTLTEYLEYLANKLDLTDGTQKNLFRTIVENKKVEVINVDKLISDLSKEYIKSKNYNVVFDAKIKKILNESLTLLKKTYPDEGILNEEINFFLEELDWIRACNIQSLEEYQTIERKGRGRTPRIIKNSKSRELIYKLLNIYRKNMYSKRMIDFSDVRRVAAFKIEILKNQKYTHIIIDEAQDLSKVQLEFILKLQNKEKSYSSLTFLYDNSQSIYLHSWLGQGKTFKSLGLKVLGRSRRLNKSFRTTKEIYQAAHNMLSKSELMKEEDENIEFEFEKENGIKPCISFSASYIKQIDSIIEIIIGLKRRGYKNRDIMIATRNKEDIERFYNDINTEYFINKGVVVEILKKKGYDFNKNVIALTTLHSVKGLESKIVILIDINEGKIPYFKIEKSDEEQILKERKLLFVAMTRASELLYISSWGEKSNFIDDIDAEYLEEVKPGLTELEKLIKDKEKTEKELKKEKEEKKTLIRENKELQSKNDIVEKDCRKMAIIIKEKEEALKYKEEQKEEVRKAIEKIKEESLNIEKESKLREELKEKIKKISDDGLECLVFAELIFEKAKRAETERSRDYTTAYKEYFLVLEIEMRKYYEESWEINSDDKYISFSELMKRLLNKYKAFTTLIYKIKNGKFIEKRNHSSHNFELRTKKECEEIRNFLLKNNGLNDFLRIKEEAKKRERK